MATLEFTLTNLDLILGFFGFRVVDGEREFIILINSKINGLGTRLMQEVIQAISSK